MEPFGKANSDHIPSKLNSCEIAKPWTQYHSEVLSDSLNGVFYHKELLLEMMMKTQCLELRVRYYALQNLRTVPVCH